VEIKKDFLRYPFSLLGESWDKLASKKPRKKFEKNLDREVSVWYVIKAFIM
jgi:hypothetical protein